MKKIQVTTAEIKAPAQIILPNTYMITKAVKAMMATDHLKDAFEDFKRHDQDIEPDLFESVETAGNFLHELIDALEGEDSENNSSSSQGV